MEKSKASPSKVIVSWSGGKDSTYMLYEMLRRGEHIDEVVCCDTTIEFPAMYVHQKKVVDNLTKVYLELKFTFLHPDYDFEYYMFDYVKQRGSKAGQKGMGWPNPNYIWCRKNLKLSVIDEYLRSKYGSDYVTCIGIAYDELDRYDFEYITGRKRYPLIEWQITELEALHGCYDLGYTWDHLYERFFRVSCWCCPLQSVKDLYCLYTYYPDLWQKLREYDDRQSNRFRKDYTLEELENRFFRCYELSCEMKSKVSDPERALTEREKIDRMEETEEKRKVR